MKTSLCLLFFVVFRLLRHTFIRFGSCLRESTVCVSVRVHLRVYNVKNPLVRDFIFEGIIKLRVWRTCYLCRFYIRYQLPSIRFSLIFFPHWHNADR